MDFFEKMKDSVSMTGQKVSQKAKTATENMRISNQIKSNDKMIEKLTYQVGNQCVQHHLNDENTEYSDLFAEIRRLKEENRTWQEELQKLSAVNTCPKCGFTNEQGMKFCAGCGTPLPEEPASGKVCSRCGAKNPGEAMFCSECGNKFE